MTNEKHEYWSKLIAEQEASGQTIRAFCKERGVADHCFYFWRKRLGLGRSEPVQFALLRTAASTALLELFLANRCNRWACYCNGLAIVLSWVRVGLNR